MLHNLKQLFSRQINPTDQFFDLVNQSMKYTNDAARLQGRKGWYVFLYSNEQRGHPHDDLTKDGKYTFPAYTGWSYSVWKKKLGKESYAIALDDPIPGLDQDNDWFNEQTVTFGAPAKKILGEVHFLSAEQIMNLDYHYRNGVEFTRRRVSLTVPYRFAYDTIVDSPIDPSLCTLNRKISARQTSVVMAYMYIGVQSYWKDIIGRNFFTPVCIQRPAVDEIPQHYEFTKIEYED